MGSAFTQIERRIKEAVESAVKDFVGSDANLFKDIRKKRSLHLVINSSFLYRDKRLVKTQQSSRRLVAELSAKAGAPAIREIWVDDTTTIKAHYRLMDSSRDLVTPLHNAVSEEIGSIGDLIFVLLATIKGLRANDRVVQSDVVKTLRLQPKQKKVFSLKDRVVIVSEIIPIEDLFDMICGETSGADSLSAKDRQAIGKAYDSLIDEATTDVVVGRGRPEETILGKILDSLRSQAHEYRTAVEALEKRSDDPAAMHNVLRIAYNFSTDVLPLIFLFMSICDLKPVIFWCTIDKQWELYRAFASLPWAALGRKERLQDYREIVAAARNQAFHHVLPFTSTVEVDLEGLNVQAQRLRLFPPYGKKEQGGIRLKDQELVDVFTEFSHARQRPVSVLFWKRNLAVIEAATNVAEAMLKALDLIRQLRVGTAKRE